MFTWDKSMLQVDVPASSVIHLFRSMRDVQVAFPGLPVQQACAYLCQFQDGDGIETVAVFHLLKSQQLAFYVSKPRQVKANQSASLLTEGLNFVESLGYLLSDLDLHLLSQKDQELLWNSLPLKGGISQSVSGNEPMRKTNSPADFQPTFKEHRSKDLDDAKENPGKNELKTEKKGDRLLAANHSPQKRVNQNRADTMEDLLAAVNSMRSQKPELRVYKRKPSSEEMKARCLALRKNLGRILSSL